MTSIARIGSPAPIVITAEGRSSVQQYRRVWRRRRVTFAVLLGLFALTFGASMALAPPLAIVIGALAIALVALPALWRRPVLGVYTIAFGIGAFEAFRLNYPDSFTDRVPFFQSFSSQGGPGWLVVTPLEFILALGLGMIALKRMAARTTPLELGPLFPAMLAYLAMVMFGLVYGLGKGGELNAALWEARPSLYLFPMYLLAVNAVRTRSHVRNLIWFFLAGIAVKSLVGVFRYLVTLGGDLSKIPEVSTYNSLLAHEESFFFALFLALVLAMLLFRSDRKQLTFGLLFSLPVLLAFLANQRRMGTLILVVGVLAVGILAYVLVRERRRLILSVVILGLILLPPYLAAFGNSQGLIGEPASAILSITRPDDRDLGSNTYRTLETQNLKYNVSIDPVQGQGFGRPMVLFLPIPDLREIFPFWEFVPHNTLLWVWLRMGIVGFIAFWFLVGRTAIESAMVAKGTRDTYLQTVASLAIVTLVGLIALAAVDMGLTDFRAIVLMAILSGVVARIPRLDLEGSQNGVEASGAAHGLVGTANPRGSAQERSSRIIASPARD